VTDKQEILREYSMTASESFIPPGPLNTAVLFLVFNRPDVTAQVFEAIRKARPPRLYVAADGPRAGREGEAERCAQVRRIATAVDWPCEVKTLFREENVGCQFGPRGGIDWFFSNEKQGIILEDDCLPSQSFFWFCQEMLVRFQENEDVMSVTGTNITMGLNFEGDYLFSKYSLMWGWASWSRAWSKYDSELDNWDFLRRDGWLKRLGLGGLLFEYNWRRIFDETVHLREKATWWDYQWIYSCWVNNGLTVVPSKNLIRNIGFSNDATHTTGYHPILANLELNDLEWPLNHTIDTEPNSAVDAFISKHWFGINSTSALKRLILRMPLATKLNNIRKKLSEKNN